MNLYSSISQRKSCRKYDLQPFKDEIMTEVGKAIGSFAPLYPNFPLEWRFTDQVRGAFSVEAPHYLIISGRWKPGEKENAGFLFQQLVLWFDAIEIGCVWLGESKDCKVATTKNDIITIGFGYTKEPVHRTREQFKRKQIDQITNAPQDLCIQAAHLAPSGLNKQPWYFKKQDDVEGKVLVYKQKLKPPLSFLYKLSDIDMGIALCHYALACKENGKEFRFSRSRALEDKSGYLPFGLLSVDE